MTKPKRLEPVDRKRCQAEMTVKTNFMTLGGPTPGSMERCCSKPTMIATETKIDPKYGKAGAMSLCDECFDQFQKRMPKGAATFKRIAEKKVKP